MSKLETRRLQLSQELHALGTDHVYYIKPSNKGMEYPCIVYRPHLPDEVKADNRTYLEHMYWDIQVIRTISNRVQGEEIIDQFKEHFAYKRQTRTGFVMDNLIYDDFVLKY